MSATPEQAAYPSLGSDLTAQTALLQRAIDLDSDIKALYEAMRDAGAKLSATAIPSRRARAHKHALLFSNDIATLTAATNAIDSLLIAWDQDQLPSTLQDTAIEAAAVLSVRQNFGSVYGIDEVKKLISDAKAVMVSLFLPANLQSGAEGL